MSDTDKTKPYWVRLKQNPQEARERHDHRDGVCDLDPTDNDCYGWSGFHGHCRIVTKDRWPYSNIYYGADRFGWFHSYIAKWNGSTRTKLRMARRNILKMNVEDIIDYDVENPRHRHNAIWENW